MTKQMEDFLSVWAKLANLRQPSDRSGLVGLFQHFRPEGIGVDVIFNGLPLGPEVLERLKCIYGATSSGFRQTDAYFVPRPTKSCGESTAQVLLKKHFDVLSRIAGKMRANELQGLLSNVTPVRVATRQELLQQASNDDSPDTRVYDTLTDFLGTMQPTDTPIELLADAMYSIANNIFIQHYVLWPLYSSSTDLNDPFLPYFELWSKGVTYRYPSPEHCVFAIYPYV